MGHAQRASAAKQPSSSKSAAERVRLVKDKLPESTDQLNSENPEKEQSEKVLKVAFAEAAHIGKRKKEQQDAHGHLEMPYDPVTRRPAFFLSVVADGVSMGQAGALASRTAVDVILKSFREQLEASEVDLSAGLAKAFAAANLEVFNLAQTRQGMATTCVAALVTGTTLITAHVGDSRVYLARKGLNLMPVTVDHSWVAELGELLVQQGLMTQQELLRDPRRHTITRAFGLEEKVEVDFNAAQLEAGDLIINCTDGLWDTLPPGSLEQFSKDIPENLNTLGERLVEAAMNAGGRDNITVALVRVEHLGPALQLPALDAMLEATANEVARRTRPILPERERKNNLLSGDNPEKASLKAYQPVGVVDLPEESGEESAVVDDIPSMKLPLLPLDKMLAKAQKSFALGEWNEAIDTYIEIERAEASYQGLYESFSTALVRYIGIAIGEGRVEVAHLLLKKLDSHRISRYHDLLADYCNDESGRAAASNHFPASKAYAEFCLRLRPNDMRARIQSDMADLYMNLQKPAITLSERLAIAQKIYARDADYGSIQDDLANIYMELGDEAIRQRALEEAANWYSMIQPLKPKDPRLLSLANNKLRSAQDQLNRQSPGSNRNLLEAPGAFALPSGTETQTNTGPSSSVLPSLERERVINEGRPEQEMINRLKDRVSRAQKAWDNGRKEVGAEYIYLVDQLNELTSLNPWQSTFPRVCYDYGKWLLDQKQYEEARPYFQKAHQLGMAAAQQRINEIDRVMRERKSPGRSATATDLPDDANDNKLRFSSSFELPTERSSGPIQTAGLFTSRRDRQNGPLIQPKPELPDSSTFVGASHAGDGVLSTAPAQPETAPARPVPSVPPASIPVNTPPPVPPRSAATIASGNWPYLGDEENQPGLRTPQAEALPVEPAPNRPPILSGTLRNPNALSNDPLQGAALREASRLAGTGRPQSLDPRNAASRRWAGFISMVKGVMLPALVMIIVLVGIALVALVVVPKFTQKNAPGVTQTAAATTTLVESTPNAPAVTGVQGIVRIQGVKADTMKVYLATAGDPNSPYREFEQEGDYFRLPATTLNRLDPKQSYLVVARPKDTDEHKWAGNLPPESPAQQPFTSSEISFDQVKGFDISLKISPQALAFYPLGGGDTDQDQPNGVHYFGPTHHSVRGDFLKFYNANGGLGRFGFPLSEEFDWDNNGHVQFFERGWLSIEGVGKPVAIGKISSALLNNSQCSDIPRLPASVTPLALPTIKPDAAFASTATNLKLGAPQTQAFDLTTGQTKIRVQYFELGRLEQNTADKKAPVTLGLLGSEYAHCVGWLK
ncbi:MAG TPA: protein phosphatase 2C domain-containing protein [Chloroflexia bacterium]|nr:protein phosphatase 2C domain-containing protein [Chloroflexia bacterium]